MGLARAFLISGARNVIATHWPTGAVSASIMRVLHEQLAAGIAPAAALRRGRLAVREDARTTHPFYWAGYVVVTADPFAWAASSF